MATKHYAHPRGRLLQFAKAPVPGQVKTRLQPPLSAAQAADLQGWLCQHTWRCLIGSELAPAQLFSDDPAHPFFARLPGAEPRPQTGADLGARMAAAFTATLAEADYAVLVGSDCPQLDAAYLDAALTALTTGNEVVIGPAADGGYVLIGMTRAVPAVMRETLFQGMPWGTDRVYTTTAARLRLTRRPWQSLALRRDLDRPEDLDLARERGWRG